MAPHPPDDEREVELFSRYDVLRLELEDPHNFFSFSEEEARRLVSSAGLPLFGRIPAERYRLIDPEEALLERSMFGGGDFGDDLCIRPWDVYDLLEALVDRFNRVNTRTPRALSQANIEHVETVTKRLRMLIQALEEPSTQLFSGGKPMEDLVRDCKAQLAKFSRWASILDRTDKEPGGDQTVEEFIKGPLANAYDLLFHRDAGGKVNGPFARFGACFFEMAGYPVAPATIIRAVRTTPRAPKKKRAHLSLVHRAA